MTFLADRLARVKPSPTMAITALATELKAAGRDIIALWSGRARFRYAAEYPRGRHRRDQARRDPLHGVRRPDRAEARDLRPSSSARTASNTSTSQITVSSGGKQVLYNATGRDVEPRRRGGDPGALLGVLPGDGAAVRRRAGAGRLLAEQRLQAAPRGSRRGDHAEDQMADPELAVEPDRRRL